MVPPAPCAEHIQNVAVVVVHVDQGDRAPVGSQSLIGVRRIHLDPAQRGFDCEVLDLSAGAVRRSGIAYKQRIVTDGIGRPRVSFRPGPGIFRIAQIRHHRHVFRQQSHVERIVVGVALSLPVVDEHGAAVFRLAGLQLRLPVPPEVLARQVARSLLTDVPYLTDQRVRILAENIVIQTQGGAVHRVLVPRQGGETRVTVQTVRADIGRGIALPAPCAHGAAVTRIGHHAIQYVQAGLNEIGLFELRVILDEIVFRVLRIRRQNLRQFPHVAGPDETVTPALAAHAVPVEALGQHPGHRIMLSRVVSGKPWMEQPVQPLRRQFGMVQSNRGGGEGGVIHARVSADPAVPYRGKRL